MIKRLRDLQKIPGLLELTALATESPWENKRICVKTHNIHKNFDLTLTKKSHQGKKRESAKENKNTNQNHLGKNS